MDKDSFSSLWHAICSFLEATKIKPRIDYEKEVGSGKKSARKAFRNQFILIANE
jgi:hypothetical protein